MSFARDDDTWAGRDDGYRRRSPGPGRRPRDSRPRSRSPPPIDRYQPRGRGGEYGRRDDGYRRRSPPPLHQANIDRYVPGQDSGAEPVPFINPIMDPLKTDTQVGFSWFAEWWRNEQTVKEDKEWRASRRPGETRRPVKKYKDEQEQREDREKEREKIQVAYDDYKMKLQAQLGRTFVTQHKTEEWFKERYDPEVRDPFRKRLVDYRRDSYAQWQADLESGMFDEFSLEGIYKNDSNGEGGVVDKEEGEAAAANEVLGVSDLLPLKGGDLRDEAINQPSLLIKTIAPHVPRDKIEAFCKEHVGEGEGGFKWLSLSEPNPLKKFHRIGWLMLHPGGDQEIETTVEKQRGDGRDEDMEDGEGTEDKMTETVTENITKSGVQVALDEINGKSIEDAQRGPFTCHVGTHVPTSSVRKRALWDLFSAPERIERDLELAVRLVTRLDTECGEDVTGVTQVEERVEEIRGRGLLQPSPSSASKPAKEIGEEDGEGEDGEMEEEEGAYDEENDDEEMLTKKKRLDLLVEYLRRVHNFCFFCVYEADSVHELTRKCPGGHLRRPRATLTNPAKTAAKASAYGEPFPLKKSDIVGDRDMEMTEEGSPVQQRGRFSKKDKTHHQLQKAFNWVKTYEDKLYQILEPDAVDIKRLGGKPMEEGLEQELKQYVKQEDESKFRCKVPDCTKLFKGEVFWRKHVEKRHTEWFEKQKKDIQLTNNYLLDPAHISPLTASSGGPTPAGFPSTSAMPASAGRGFNVPAMATMGHHMTYPNIPTPGSFPQSFSGYPIPIPPNPMGYGNPAFAGPGMMGGVGPMRRGGGRYGGRMPGPYDRQQAVGGRKMGGAFAGGMKPRFPDAVGAGGPTDPNVAVGGRTLKSYTDLDAVDGEVGDELDY